MKQNSGKDEDDELYPADGSIENDGGDQFTEEGRAGEPEEEEVKTIKSPIIPNTPSRERLFVALAWLPKATVQAAMGPLALDKARQALARYSNI